jgi:hypothetical protein
MDSGTRSPRRQPAISYSLALAGLAALAALLPGRADAIPAYARRYDTKCETCHFPMPPRLNNTGILFRRSGFRLPDADDKGNLTLNAVPAHSIGEAASVVANFAGRFDQVVNPGESKSTMEFGEVVLLAGTAVGEHLSAQTTFIPHTEEGTVELEGAEFQANYGKPGGQWSIRGGLIEPNLWQKGTHGTITLAGNLALSDASSVPVGSFPGFAIGHNQVGMEGGYTYTRLHNGKSCTTMLSAAVLNGVDETGDPASRNTTDGADVYFQAIQLFGARNTAGAFYYKGRTLIDPLGLLLPPGPFRDHFSRYGVMGNYVFLDRLDLEAAFADGKDHSDEINGNVVSRGAFAQADFQIRDRWVADYRRDYYDPDRGVGDDLIRAHTVSTTYQADDNLFFTVEYNQINEAGTLSHGFIGNVRFVY